jgi:hypothetical protein
MECGKSWGSELEALSVDNWDFLDDERFKKIIAIEGDLGC